MNTAYQVRQVGVITVNGAVYRVQEQSWPWGLEMHLRHTITGRLHYLRPATSPGHSSGLYEVIDTSTHQPLTNTTGTPVLVVLLGTVLEAAPQPPTTTHTTGITRGRAADQPRGHKAAGQAGEGECA